MGESNNPFVNQDFLVETTHVYTKGDPSKYPYKTLNRLLDDIKWGLAFRLHCANISILERKPIEYAVELANLARSGATDPQMILLNNELPFFRSRDVVELNESNENQSLTTIRGLLIMQEINHFRIQVLENRSPFFSSGGVVNKNEYHVVPKSFLSEDDVKQFESTDYPSPPNNVLEEVFACTSNNEVNHIIRITIYTSEFSPKEIESLTSHQIIKERYLKESENHANLDPDTIPNGSQCVQKLINVLKGPLMSEPDAPGKTINLEKTVLASIVDIDMISTRLGFILEKSTLIPPTVHKLPGIKEGYQRKIVELIYIGRSINVENNEFRSTYAFNDKLSLIYSTFNEVDKSVCLAYGSMHDSTKYPAFIALSCCSFFQTELIIKCFENTVYSDPGNQLQYVDYLHETSRLKQDNHRIRSYLHNQNRKGLMFGLSDYIKCLKDLSINPSEDQTKDELLGIDDSYIISVYQTNIQGDSKNFVYFNKILRTIAMIKNSQPILEFLQNELIPMNLALNDLAVEDITEDEVVITAFEFKLSELTEIDEITTLNRSIYSVAVNRKSFILMNYIEQNLPDLLGQYNTPLSVDESYEILGATKESTEFEIVEKVKAKYLSTDIRVLRQALRSLDSKIIENYLMTGKIDTSLLPAENWPAGLDNIGNTCYLNSLLQYYFSIKPLRDMVLEFEEHDIDMMDEAERKIGGRRIDINETKRANQFIYHLQRLFDEMIHTDTRCVRPSKDLAYLSFLPSSQQVNFVTMPPRGRMSSGGENDPIVVDDETEQTKSEGQNVGNGRNEGNGQNERQDDDLIVLDDENEGDPFVDTDTGKSSDKEGQEVTKDPTEPKKTKTNTSNLIDLDTNSIEEIDPFDSDAMDTTSVHEPKILPINTMEMESTIEMGRQQDVTECIENVNFQIETALDPETIEEDGEQYDLIKKLFYGKITQTISPLDGSANRSSVERFSSLIINISDHPKNIYDALDNYFNADVVDLEEGSVKKTLSISKLPHILQFQIQRVLFDRERLVAYKSIEPIPFGEKLYLDRYLDTQDKEILEKREEVFEMKNHIKSLKETKNSILRVDKESNLNIIDALSATRGYLESLGDENIVSGRTVQHIESEILRLKEQVKEIDTEIQSVDQQITNQFKDYKNVAYSIFAVFIHRGEANYGHYWIYIKDPHQKNVFRKYNDEIVTEVPDEEVFNFVEGNTTTPYYIAYVKEELEQDYVEPLKRVIRC